MSLSLGNVKSLCILRLSAIGDVCHAVAMVQAIQREYPQVEITWVIGKIEYQLLKHLPKVKFVIFDKSKGWRAYLDLYRVMKGQKFDVLLHMQVALRASIAAMLIPAKVKVGFDRPRAKEGQFLFTNTQIEAQTSPHVLDGFMAFAKTLGVKDISPRWNIPVPETDTKFAKNHIPDEEKSLIICPSASKAERNWLADRYAAIANYACSKGFNVYLCGGPSELEKNLAQQIISQSENSLVNLVGQTTLTQMLALLKQASLVIAPDTGPAHMAVTQGTPVIGLYAHSNPKRTGPYLYQDFVVSVYEDVMKEQFPQGYAWGTRAKGVDLMHRININAVKQQIDKLINNIDSKPTLNMDHTAQ